MPSQTKWALGLKIGVSPKRGTRHTAPASAMPSLNPHSPHARHQIGLWRFQLQMMVVVSSARLRGPPTGALAATISVLRKRGRSASSQKIASRRSLRSST